jgi:IS5 family transposase
MKAHVGVDSKTKIIHTAVATAANVSDVAMLPDLVSPAVATTRRVRKPDQPTLRRAVFCGSQTDSPVRR